MHCTSTSFHINKIIVTGTVSVALASTDVLCYLHTLTFLDQIENLFLNYLKILQQELHSHTIRIE